LVLALAWGVAVPTAKFAHLTERPPIPQWYPLMTVAPTLNVSFFELARIPIDDNTTPIVAHWAMLKRYVDPIVGDLQQPQPDAEMHQIEEG
jgi:hypothetical protein